MPKDKRIDEYINRAQPFAKPVLNKLRGLIHKTIPEVEETIKWGMPFFEYKGPVCNFAAFKQHAVFGFWKHQLMDDPEGRLKENSAKGGEAMGNLGRITGIKDLPADKVITGFLKQAKTLNAEGIKPPPKKKTPVKETEIPGYFSEALKNNKAAEKEFNKFPPSHKKEYVEWITEAKAEATRLRRLKTAMEWIGEGKPRNWKYISKKKGKSKKGK